MYLLVFYVPSTNNHLGFEPGDSNLSRVKHSCMRGDALWSFTWKGKKNRLVDNNQPKFSRHHLSEGGRCGHQVLLPEGLDQDVAG